MSWKKIFRPLDCSKKRPLERAGIRAGLYSYHREVDGRTSRFHLRVDQSGNGLLLANASAGARLRASGVLIAKCLLEDKSDDAIGSMLQEVFRDTCLLEIEADIRAVRELIAHLELPENNYSIINLDDPLFSPNKVPLERPLTADVPLDSYLKMEVMLKRLWDERIPHVIIHVEPKFKAKDLIRTVEKAEDLGLITGVRGQGGSLAHCTIIPDLAQAGLDHLTIFCVSLRDEIHDALLGHKDHEKAVKAMVMAQKHEICPVTIMPLIQSSLETMDETFAKIEQCGVSNSCLYGLASTDPADRDRGAILAEELVQTAQIVEESAEKYGIRIMWYPPVRFDPTVSMKEQIIRGPRCSGDTAIRVESDGRVLLSRGRYELAGNLLKQTWAEISEGEVYKKYRARLETDTHCTTCPGLAICAADCPKNPEGWADLPCADGVVWI